MTVLYCLNLNHELKLRTKNFMNFMQLKYFIIIIFLEYICAYKTVICQALLYKVVNIENSKFDK